MAQQTTKVSRRIEGVVKVKGLGNPKHDKAARRPRPHGKIKRLHLNPLRNHGSGTTASYLNNPRRK